MVTDGTNRSWIIRSDESKTDTEKRCQFRCKVLTWRIHVEIFQEINDRKKSERNIKLVGLYFQLNDNLDCL